MKVKTKAHSVYGLSQPNFNEFFANDLTRPRSANWSKKSRPEHFVQFYETSDFLLNSLGEFVKAGLSTGEAVIVVASRTHRANLEKLLKKSGVNMSAARASAQFISLDAAELLSKFMVEGAPSPVLFTEIIGDIIAGAAEKAGGRPVRIFGEMVAILVEEGNPKAALVLENLWNDLGKTHSFSLFCAYPINCFDCVTLAPLLNDVCTGHTRVIPAESYTALAETDDRSRTIIQLQQKARLLENEIEERQVAENALRSVKDELELQVEDLRRLHEMSVSLTSRLDVDFVLNEVLQAALSMQNTEMGLLSLCVPERRELNLKVQSGFDAEFLKIVEWASTDGPCGTCYERQERVVVENTETDPIFSAYREAARKAGFRASHSIPLTAHNGKTVGVLSVHFRRPHRPSERETRLMDLYGRMAADAIENALSFRKLQQAEQERAELLAREQAARLRAEEANRMKDEFLATVSHELRTPLNAIVGWSHMLRGNQLDQETVSHALGTIEYNARAQAQLIEDILDVSRVIAGKLRLKTESVDLAAIIKTAVDSLQPAADSKNIQILAAPGSSADCRISGDAARLQQIICNLLSNAIKFTPPGGRVEIQLERDASDIQIRVTDTGKGISPDFLPLIFESFSQGDSSSTRRHGGLGLGLAIVRQLVELHGGTVCAQSDGEGCGATFTVRLPVEF